MGSDSIGGCPYFTYDRWVSIFHIFHIFQLAGAGSPQPVPFAPYASIWRGIPAFDSRFLSWDTPPATVGFPRSGRQGRESWGVKVPLPSIVRFGRLAYPLLGEVTNRDMRGRKSHGGPGCGCNNMPCGGNDLGGEQTRRPEHQRMQPREQPPYRSRCAGYLWSADLLRKWGRPMPCGKKRVGAPWGPPG